MLSTESERGHTRSKEEVLSDREATRSTSKDLQRYLLRHSAIVQLLHDPIGRSDLGENGDGSHLQDSITAGALALPSNHLFALGLAHANDTTDLDQQLSNSIRDTTHRNDTHGRLQTAASQQLCIKDSRTSHQPSPPSIPTSTINQCNREF